MNPKQEIKRINKDIAHMFKALRKINNVSQEQVGEWLGIHQGAVSRIESGNRELTCAEHLLFRKMLERSTNVK